MAENRIDDTDRIRGQILAKFLANPRICHEVLFRHRHPQKTPPFHQDIITDWWSDAPYAGTEAFRGGAKSTLSEEAICAQALMERFQYGLIVGNSYSRAAERLAAIKFEIDHNDQIRELFGDQHGDVWSEGEIILKNGVKLQAVGARQSLRGAKHRDRRPDMLFIDDLEDEENVDTVEQRDKLRRWLFRSLLPACDPKARVRIVGTPLAPESLLEVIRTKSGWPFRVVPIVTPPVSDHTQWEKSNWPERFSLEWVKQKRDEMEATGELQGFVQEYLCQSEEQALKPFQQRHIVPAPEIPLWTPSVVICDPARTTDIRKSARTGYAVVSWIANRLYVRYAKGEFHKPSEIIDELCRLDAAFNPIAIAVEKDGLEEFLMQPLRQRVLDRGQPLPIVPVNAPRDKNKVQFIKGLQPFFEAREVFMCGHFPDLETELLGFPTGRVDVLNALAYAPRLRAGKPVYDDFDIQHIAPDDLEPTRRDGAKLWCVLNVAGSHTAAALVQHQNGGLRVFYDWIKEGDTGSAVEALMPVLREAAGGIQVRFFAPAEQFDEYTNLGLARVLRRWNLAAEHGPLAGASVGALAPFLRQRLLVQPAFLVAHRARWTLNALAGGYARHLDKAGMLKDQPEFNYYATLMGALESFGRFLTVQGTAEDAIPIQWQSTSGGRRFISARADLRGGDPAELKAAAIPGGIVQQR